MDWDEPFGTLLARLRKDAGLTQERLADEAGLSVRAISSLECGVRHPRRFTLDRLAGALRLSAAQRSGLIIAAQRARDDRAPTDPPASRPTPLIGRAGQLDRLRRHLAGDGPPVLVFEGEAGIGKSRMLAEAAALGTVMGLAVLIGTANPGGGEDFAPFAQLLAEQVRRATAAMLTGCAALRLLLPELGDRLPLLPAADAGSGEESGGVDRWAHHRRLIFDAVARYLDAFGRGRRRLLVLDDLHQAGPQAGALLVHLVRGSPADLRVVASVRSGEADGPVLRALAELGRHGELHGAQLAPLGGAEAAELVASAADPVTLPRSTRNSVVRRAGGLPLHLVELSRAAANGGVGEIPWHLRIAIGQQLTSLPESVLRLLRVLAVAGPGVSLGALSATELEGLDLACRRGILTETRQGLRFRYPLVREVLATSLGPTRRRLWRETLAATG
jgi:transcriptional regulator with XRE-family HTH domain